MTDAWYTNPVWVGIWIAAIGSFIAVIGQLTAAYLPILTSDSASDFTISVDNIYHQIIKDSTSNDLKFYAEGYNPNASELQDLNDNATPTNSLIITGIIVKVTDLHSILKPYQHSVFVNVSRELPKGMKIAFSKPEGKPPLFIIADIMIANEIKAGHYPIEIQGLGGDGKIRSCRIHIYVKESEVSGSSDRVSEAS